MRANGVRRYADGALELELDPTYRAQVLRPSPRETREERFKREDASAEAKADNELTEEQKARAKHDAYWKRITRSSGAPIPEFHWAGGAKP